MGWEPNTDDTKRMLYEWADLIIVLEAHFRDLLPEEFRDKAMVIFDVGPDRWVRSLDPELTELLDGMCQQYLDRQKPQESAEVG